MGGSSQSMLLASELPPVAKTGMLGFLSGGAGGGGTFSAPFYTQLGKTNPSSSKTVSVNDFALKQHLMLIRHVIPTGLGTESNMRFGNGSISSSTEYASRRAENFGSTQALTSKTSWFCNAPASLTTGEEQFGVSFMENYDGIVKSLIDYEVDSGSGAPAGTAPNIQENVAKFVETDQINYAEFFNSGTNNYDDDSEFCVLGYNDDETDGTSVWEELKNITTDAGQTEIDSGTFADKDYLWFFFYGKHPTTTLYPFFRANNTTSNVYSYQKSINGGSTTTTINQPNIDCYVTSTGQTWVWGFIVNKEDYNKLINYSNAGTQAGAGNTVDRRELVAGMANSSTRITSLKFFGGNNPNQYDAGSRLLIFGYTAT